MSRIKLYIILMTSCVTGYVWLFFSYMVKGNGIGVCIIKHTTTLPCPSCGSTRSVLSLLRGEILESLYWNPFGILIASIMLIAPIWIIYDVALSKGTLMQFYKKIELTLQQKRVAVPMILLVLLNWIWNIYKGL